MNTQRKATKYSKPVGIKDGSIYFLNDTFEYESFKGATGIVFDPVSQNEIDQYNDLDNVTEWYHGIWQESVAAGDTEQSLKDYTQDCLDYQDGEYPGHDNSYSELHEEAKKHFDDDNIETFNCSGVGRCFDEELLNSFDQVIDHELIKIIKQFENIKNEKEKKAS